MSETLPGLIRRNCPRSDRPADRPPCPSKRSAIRQSLQTQSQTQRPLPLHNRGVRGVRFPRALRTHPTRQTIRPRRKGRTRLTVVPSCYDALRDGPEEQADDVWHSF